MSNNVELIAEANDASRLVNVTKLEPQDVRNLVRRLTKALEVAEARAVRAEAASEIERLRVELAAPNLWRNE